MKKLKILCICLHGNTRSVALAYLIKTIYGHDAIAIGLRETNMVTKLMLYDWAERIFILDKNLYVEVIKKQPINKNEKSVSIIDVGPDIWFNPKHPELIHKLLKQINTLGL